MIVHAILFIVLPLAVAWLAGASAYFPPYPAPKTEPVENPKFETEVRVFLAQHNELGTTADTHTLPGLQSTRRDRAATSSARLAA
jgi:hypothetical protein